MHQMQPLVLELNSQFPLKIPYLRASDMAQWINTLVATPEYFSWISGYLVLNEENQLL